MITQGRGLIKGLLLFEEIQYDYVHVRFFHFAIPLRERKHQNGKKKHHSNLFLDFIVLISKLRKPSMLKLLPAGSS